MEIRKTVLETAEQLINGDREESYGSAAESFDRIAMLWGVYLDAPELNAKDVAHMLILMKVSRLVTSPDKLDNYIDIAGYAALGAEL